MKNIRTACVLCARDVFKLLVRWEKSCDGTRAARGVRQTALLWENDLNDAFRAQSRARRRVLRFLHDDDDTIVFTFFSALLFGRVFSLVFSLVFIPTNNVLLLLLLLLRRSFVQSAREKREAKRRTTHKQTTKEVSLRNVRSFRSHARIENAFFFFLVFFCLGFLYPKNQTRIFSFFSSRRKVQNSSLCICLHIPHSQTHAR